MKKILSLLLSVLMLLSVGTVNIIADGTLKVEACYSIDGGVTYTEYIELETAPELDEDESIYNYLFMWDIDVDTFDSISNNVYGKYKVNDGTENVVQLSYLDNGDVKAYTSFTDSGKTIKIADDESYVNFGLIRGGIEPEPIMDVVNYNGVDYKFGFAHFDTEGGINVMHIDGGDTGKEFRLATDTIPSYISFLGFAKVDDDTPADSGLYSQIKSGSVSLTIKEYIKGEEGDLSVVTPSAMNQPDLNIDTWKLQINVENTKEIDAIATVSFEYKIGDEQYEQHSTDYHIVISKVKDATLDFSSDVDFTNAISALSSVDDLKQVVSDSCEGLTLDEATKLEVKLPKDKTYNGVITVDCGTPNSDFKSLDIIGENTTIGGIEIISGVTTIKNVIFDAEQATAYTDGFFNGKKVGILTSANEYKDGANDCYIVQGCSFQGYDYGIASYNYGLVSGMNECNFNICKTGIYVNTNNFNFYSNSTMNIFNGCDIGIDIVKIPDHTSPYQFIHCGNDFFHEDTGTFYDYQLSATKSGTYYYTKNYYGTDASSRDGDHVRSARVNYVGTSSKIVTNPCVRYPDSAGNIYGIDSADGLFSALLNGTDDDSAKINVNDINNGNFKLSFCNLENNDLVELGSITFGE